MSKKLNAREMISKAKISLLNHQPFFGALTIHLKPIEINRLPTAGIDQYGNLYYNKKWIEALTDDECEAVLVHEVLHCVFKDMERRGHRQEVIWNYALDFVNNLMIKANHFKLPKGALIDDKWKDMIKEEVYDKLMKNVKVIPMSALCKSNKCGSCKMSGKGKKKQGQGVCRKGVWDYHLGENDSKQGIGKGAKGREFNEKDWRGILSNAYKIAKSQGNIPAGMDRIFNQLTQPKVNWKSILLRFIESHIPRDYTWRKPSKRSASLGVYMPRTLKEFIQVTIAIDTSGSISDQEYDKFISECCGIARAFQSIRMTIISADCKIQHVYEIDNNFNPHSVVCKGRGGTDHVCVFEYIKKEKPDTKLLVCFTDLYTTVPPKNSPLYKNLNVLWVLTKDHGDIKMLTHGHVIEMEPKTT